MNWERGEMTLPSFLGLGANRSGSTWLDSLLRRHPRVYLPTRRKELHYFDQHYGRGTRWYEAHFPSPEEAASYDQIGEITPKYIYDPEVPARIEQLLPDCRFLIILRNPADRAYSQYKALVQHFGVRQSFAKQLQSQPELFERGLYARQIERYFERFPREHFQILFFEHAVRSPEETCRKLAEFLSLDFEQFDLPAAAVRRKVNYSSIPQFPRTYLFGRRLARGLRACGQGWLVFAATRLGLRKFFRDGKPFPPLDARMRRDLLHQYEDPISQLEALLDVNLDCWRHGRESNRAPVPVIPHGSQSAPIGTPG
jgi:hypothetical protein